MQQFSKGQRWISDTEPDLGLGTVIDGNGRQITVVFMATGETRLYAKETAPLTRISFSKGDTVVTHDEKQFLVNDTRESEGVLTYLGRYIEGETAPALPDSTTADVPVTIEISEAELSNLLTFNFPQDRLFAGQIDNRKWFNLRSDVFRLRFDMDRSVIRGLLGSRISLIPHQIYIASEVSRRLSPRVLLADEVGLGKTIEAGMILHSQIVNHQVNRVLIVVPETLIHQWLVEMMRRFSLCFSIIDHDSYRERMPSSPDDNPFLGEQLCLCSLESLLENPDMEMAVVEGQWDMLVVDEAHHLHWEENNPSDAYSLIEEIATAAPSVLLLTATPEQLGQEGHFARLRLLDPDRFGNFNDFCTEGTNFNETALVATALLEEPSLTETEITSLETVIDNSLNKSERAILTLNSSSDLIGLREKLLAILIDRHGTGRVLFRNSRSAISGFPDRMLHHHQLDSTESADDYGNWLKELLKTHYPEKVLLICAQTTTVKRLSEWLRVAGISSAQFHGDMTIVERDRAAAWFADDEESCQLLICSEIGSEGRNFQFLHHLVTFELPTEPDLLEQRIGRLDRIGQVHDIQIHVPTSTGSRDDRLMQWYHRGLNAFESICKTGTTVATQLSVQLEQALAVNSNIEELEILIAESASLSARLNNQLEQGRDRLLEMNSNRTELITEHLDELNRENRSFRLPDFMAKVFDCFGVESEEQSNGSWILRPGDHMQVANFPMLPVEGVTVTFDRAMALQREDFSFLTWDHPMVNAAMDMVLNEAYGQANGEIIDTPLLPKGVLYVEALLTWNCAAPKELNIHRYFPEAGSRFLLGSNRKDYTGVLSDINIDATIKRSDKTKIRRFLQQNRPDIEVLINYTERLATNQIAAIVASAQSAIIDELDPEIERLEELKKINPAVRNDEIDKLRSRKTQAIEALQNTRHELVAVSVLLNL